jgi:high-affinity nickel permease
MDTLFALFLAGVVGFGHAFEADHLLAVSSLVSKRNSFWAAVKDGIAWGMGHTSTILVVGLVVMGFKTGVDAGFFHYLEAAVGMMLVLLGIFRIIWLFKKGPANHVHFHWSDLLSGKKQKETTPSFVPFNHITTPVNAATASALRFNPAFQKHKLAYGVGLIHGLAGSGTLVVLVMSQINGLANAMAYLIIFGVGSMVGMSLASGFFSLPFSQKWASYRKVQVAFTVFSSLLCIGYGVLVMGENLGLI